MKILNRNELERIANTYDATLIFHETVTLDFGGYGFEATERNLDTYYAFKFFGHSSKQIELINVWSLLTNKATLKPFLTIETAKALLNKKIRVSYEDTNEGEYIIIITGMEEKSSNSIGQKTEQHLLFKEVINGKVGNIESWIYEWHGIFRRGSGAERLFIEEVFEEEL